MARGNSLVRPTLRGLAVTLGAGLLGGLLLVGCGFAVPAPPGPLLTTLPPTAPTTTTTTTTRTTSPDPVSPVATEAPIIPPARTTTRRTDPRPPAAPPTSNGGGNAGDNGGGWCGMGFFFIMDGNCAHDPAWTPGTPWGAWPPPGAVARCADGAYGFSRVHNGTCAGHGGVAQWL